MKKAILLSVLLFSSVIVLFAQNVDSGSWYSRVQWPHDGIPYESQHFIVYSDGASQEVRQSIAEIGETFLMELTSEFGIIGDEMFRFPPGQDKIHIFAYKDRYPQAWGARAYYGGLIIWSLDHERRNTNLNSYVPTFTHELVHVLESLLKGRDVADEAVAVRVNVWFSEGLAEAITGGTSGGAVKDLGYMNYLTAKFGKLSPVAFKHDGQVGDWKDIATSKACFEYHYPMYQLAVEYLMDEDGLGKTPQDITYIFTDIAEGATFPTAFENRMGISLKDYEVQFFDLMNDYLEEGGIFKSIKHLTLVWLVLIATSLFIIVWYIARDNRTRLGIKLYWVLVTMFFGPFGLLVYLFLCKQPGQQASRWWRALGASMFSVTGNAVGLMVVFAFYNLFRADILIYLTPLLVGWLIFRAPLVAVGSGSSYLSVLLRTLFAEFISTILVLIGMLPVLIQLPTRWVYVIYPDSWLFLGCFLLGVIGGVIILYPYNIWKVHRNSAIWPNCAI